MLSHGLCQWLFGLLLHFIADLVHFALELGEHLVQVTFSAIRPELKLPDEGRVLVRCGIVDLLLLPLATILDLFILRRRRAEQVLRQIGNRLEEGR